MSTYTQVYYHIVFSTKNRQPCLTKNNRPKLFRYIWGIIKNKKCRLVRINGVEGHLHILTSLHPNIALADLLRNIKAFSSKWIKQNNIFPCFANWQDGYAAFTLSFGEVEQVTEYIIKQEQHHLKKSFVDEYKALLAQSGVQFDSKYLL